MGKREEGGKEFQEESGEEADSMNESLGPSLGFGDGQRWSRAWRSQSAWEGKGMTSEGKKYRRDSSLCSRWNLHRNIVTEALSLTRVH